MQSLKVKVFTCFLSFVMAFSLIPAFQSNADRLDFAYTAGANVTATLSGGTLTVKGTGAMKNFRYDTEKKETDIPWYRQKDNITKVVIENGVTTVGNYSFIGCTNLKEIVWPTNGSMKTIGYGAFAYCSMLSNVTFPNGLVTIGTYAFDNDSALKTISLPKSLRRINNCAFMHCTHLTRVAIPARVTVIGNYAFYGCYDIASVTGGAGLVSIGRQAFMHCWGLKKFSIGSKKLKKIGVGAFACDSRLRTIFIKKTTKLTKKGVKGSLYLSSIKTVKVKKSKVRKYKKIFKRSNSGKSVKVKK